MGKPSQEGSPPIREGRKSALISALCFCVLGVPGLAALSSWPVWKSFLCSGGSLASRSQLLAGLEVGPRTLLSKLRRNCLHKSASISFWCPVWAIFGVDGGPGSPPRVIPKTFWLCSPAFPEINFVPKSSLIWVPEGNLAGDFRPAFPAILGRLRPRGPPPRSPGPGPAPHINFNEKSAPQTNSMAEW